MDGGYKDLLEQHLSDLCEGMAPSKVASRLVKHGVFVDYDVQILDSIVTNRLKNEHIVNALMERGFDSLTKFLCALTSIDHIHRDLAEKLQPVRNCITCFSASPTHAAAVVHVLEKHAGAKFSGMKRVGQNKGLVERRARIFPKEYNPDDFPKPPLDVVEVVKHSHDTELRLLFPTSSSLADAESALGSWLQEEGAPSSTNLVVMCGVSKGEEGGGAGGRVLIGTKCVQGGIEARAGLKEAELESLERALSESMHSTDDKPSWLQEFKDNVPKLEFCQLQCPLSTGKADAATADSADSKAQIVTDPLAYSFYQFCQEFCPKKRSLVCCGVHLVAAPCDTEERDLSPAQPQHQQETESAAAIRSSCLLMEICKHYYPQVNSTESLSNQLDDSDDDN